MVYSELIARPPGRALFAVASLAALGCSLDGRRLAASDPALRDPPDAAGAAGAGSAAPPGREGSPALGGLGTEPGSGGVVAPSCDGGACGPACVPAGPRDCASPRDNDCDGQADDTLDAVCVCAPASSEPCDAHPGLDGRGPCRAGSRTCVATEGGSDWGPCEGAVGPGERDSCEVVGDDSDCDGTSNGGCPCIDGEVRACGPQSELGLCARGTQTCQGGAFAACVGAVFPAARDCSSPEDNDCDGEPDDTVDDVCLPPRNPFSCATADPPPAILPLSLFPVDPDTGAVTFPPGAPPAATGGPLQDGRYTPIRMEVYGQAGAPAFVVNELTFELRDGFAVVGYHAYVGTGAVLGSGALTFVGTATPVGNALRLGVVRCDAEPCSASGELTCAVPELLPYATAANTLVTIQAASDGSTVVTTYARE